MTDQNETLPPPAPPQPLETNSEARTMGMLCHLLGIFTGFLGPLILWLVKREESPFVDDQGKEALNFQITVVLASMVGAATACLIIGFFILIAVWIANLVFSIIGTMEANKGVRYRYPICLRLIK